MKQNKIFRLSAILLVLTLLSTCVISGTFAKYTTAKSATDSATVAAWGIELTVEGDNTLYDDSKTGDEVSAVVKANNLAAPGTYQKLATVTLTGTPEVAYKITVVVDLTLANWTDGTDVYCPIVFTVDGTEIKLGGAITNTGELETAVENAIKKAIAGDESGIKTYNAGVAVPGSAADAVLIDWTWAFEGNDDVKDTILGNAAAKATIGFSLSVTVEQVDAI